MSGQSRLALHDQGAPPQAVYAVFRDALGGTGCPEFNACAHGAKTVVRAVELRWSTQSGINSDPSVRKTQPLITIRVAAPSASARKSRTGCTRSLHRLAYFPRHSHRQRQRSRAVAFWLAGSSQADCLDRGHTVDTRLRHGIVPHIATFVLATVIHVFFLGAKQAAG